MTFLFKEKRSRNFLYHPSRMKHTIFFQYNTSWAFPAMVYIIMEKTIFAHKRSLFENVSENKMKNGEKQILWVGSREVAEWFQNQKKCLFRFLKFIVFDNQQKYYYWKITIKIFIYQNSLLLFWVRNLKLIKSHLLMTC